MASEQAIFEFIIVGAGPSGCALAASLAKTVQRPRVLLLEAGGRNDDDSQRIDGKRWTTFMGEQMNWGYKTTPQEYCSGQQIDYSRGKGLGGGSAINFGVYSIGARDDYDQWATEVADDMFSWKQMQARFINLETFTGDILAAENRKFAQPNAADHGHVGGLATGYAQEWDSDLPLVLDALEQAGLQRNLDHNSGNPLGLGLTINSASKGRRTTGADLLAGVPDNLVIITDSPAQRVILEEKRAVGVESNGKKYMATKEVILSAGSLDTPRILMHSGIGPAKELQKFNIPVTHDLPAIGQGLRDHFFVPLILTRNPATNDRTAFYGNNAAMAAAQTQWEKDNTGPWTKYACQIGSGWFKSNRITSSPEFQALPNSVRDFMNRETVPQWELIAGFPVHFLFPDLFKDYSYICLAVFLMNEQSVGEVRLQSSNPDVPLLFNPRAMEHPFDRRACIEMYRHLLEVTQHPSFAKDTTATVLGPKSDSDEDILQFWKDNLSSAWHMTGTVKMGKPGSVDAAVDSHFRVFGIENLRVADMSVVPVLTNNHTQTTAYVTGATCADVLIKEYGLEQIPASF
ncbi:hypothetical protein N7492_009897 [Penicillium capsulatum]|uniref:Glucose-methanol-choline oxidoreductase N-terminal domain-containing protein n=1 Tax=Penicillium capsulatum TaxID=69766 RepID=A0A9W9HNK0_9EURO|nr:hypothetical protein N7492_009897 [Penicillium capsulatum]KAJ6112408.1 hypothetical protein N7512_007732 [Penicillium capsulatum]